MTTKVTVDAHAGWPVEVTIIDTNNEGGRHENRHVVPANAEHDFYVHSHRELHIRELKRETP